MKKKEEIPVLVRQGHKIGHDVKDALLASDLPILDVLVHVEPFGGVGEA